MTTQQHRVTFQQLCCGCRFKMAADDHATGQYYSRGDLVEIIEAVPGQSIYVHNTITGKFFYAHSASQFEQI